MKRRRHPDPAADVLADHPAFQNDRPPQTETARKLAESKALGYAARRTTKRTGEPDERNDGIGADEQLARLQNLS